MSRMFPPLSQQVDETAYWPGRHPEIHDRFSQHALPDEAVDLYLCGEVFRSGTTTALTAAELAQAFLKEGLNFACQLSGCFALAIWQQRQASLHLVSDKFGTVPLYYQLSSSASFSTDLDALVRLQPPQLSLQAVFNYIFFHCIPTPDCIYQGMAKVPPATIVSIGQQGRAQQTYWQPEYRYLEDRSQAHQQLRDTLAAAVDRSIRPGEKAGAFLSGGLDSSTVAAMMRHNGVQPVTTFTIGFDEPAYDESPYAKLVADALDTDHTVFEVTPAHVLQEIHRIAAFCPEPFGNSSALPALFCSQAAREHGISVLLAGDGGDELFAGNSRYLEQKVFRPYNALPQWGRKGLEWCFQHLPNTLPLVPKACSYIDQANTPLPWRLRYHNYLLRHPLDTIFTDAFLEQIDPGDPARLERECYQAAPGQDELEKLLYFDWKLTLTDNDLVKVSLMAQLAGIEVRYPMLDDELVALSCRIPPKWMLPGRRLRGFYKDALAPVLPKATLTKSKHGFGLPFGIWLQSDPGLRQLVNDAFATLKQRQWLRADFLDRLLHQHQQGQAQYYGELVWVLTMLELWLRQHEPAAAPS